MRVPALVWDRRHNVARLTVSFGRTWHRREIRDEAILGFNATGRLSRVVLLDPGSLLPPAASVGEALAAAIRLLREDLSAAELEVLTSALTRSGPAREVTH